MQLSLSANLEKELAERLEGARSPGEKHGRGKRNTLKPGRAGTPVRMKRTLSINKNSFKILK